MSFEVTGKLIEKFDTQQVNDRFRKREFVMELAEEINGNVYTNFAKMQLVQTKCDILDRFNIGDTVKVNFNIKGNRWERDGRVNYITNLDVWRIEAASAAAPGAGQQQGSYGNNNNYNNGGGNYAGNTGNAGGNSVAFNATNNYNPSPESADDLPF